MNQQMYAANDLFATEFGVLKNISNLLSNINGFG
jgi:hypothetical protein